MTKPLPHHPLAQLFPPMQADEYQDLLASIQKNGQKDDIVVLEGKILDGVNRDKACRAAGIEPRTRPYSYVHDGQYPIDFVAAKNLHRRHLTPSVRAAIAADLIPLLTRPAQTQEKPSAAPLAAAPGPADEFDQSLPMGAEDESQEGPPEPAAQLPGDAEPLAEAPAKKTPKPRAKKSPAIEAAASITKASPAAVQQAVKLKETDPDKFDAVKAGTMSLSAATAAVSKETAEGQAYDAALQRIQEVCGHGLYQAAVDGTRLKGKKEVKAYAALTNDEMLLIRNFIEDGWSVAKAMKFKTKTLGRTHRISDLLDRAVQSGGMFTLEIAGWRVAVSKIGEPPPANA